MKINITILFLLFFLSSFGQTFEFKQIKKRVADGWETRDISGVVYIDKDAKSFIIKTQYNTQELYLLSYNQFTQILDMIYMCVDSQGVSINLRIVQDNAASEYFEMYYYSDVGNQKYFKFCLKKI